MNLFYPMLLVGLVTSVHCVTMCGTMVLSYAIKGDEEGPFLKRMLPHFAYHGAKILSYMIVGLALGAIGSAFNLGGIRGWVTVFAGLFMVLMGLNMTGKFPWLRWITLRPPKFLMRAIMKVRKKANADEAAGESTLLTPLMFGSLTGLMPCGPLQSAQIAAAGAGSALAGSIAMLGFGLGTMPLLLGFGAVSGMLGAKFKDRMMTVAALVIVLVGLVMLNRGAMLIGSPVTFNTARQYVLGSPSAEDTKYTVAKDGVVEVKLAIVNTKYVPAALNLPADKPVRLIVDRQEDTACSAQLAIPQLGVLANLKPNGTTVVDVPASKAGGYTLTCGMGMMAGSINVGDAAGAPAGGKLPLYGLLVAAGVIGVWTYRRRGSAEPQAQPAYSKGGQKKGGAKAVGNAAPATAGATVFGFSPSEVLVIGAAVSAAVVAGLFFGGLL
jgi:sulfite exporter TauE/SafE